MSLRSNNQWKRKKDHKASIVVATDKKVAFITNHHTNPTGPTVLTLKTEHISSQLQSITIVAIVTMNHIFTIGIIRMYQLFLESDQETSKSSKVFHC